MKFAAVNVSVVSSVPLTAIAASVGATLVAFSVSVTVAAAEEIAPSDAVTVKVFAPVSFAAGT